MILRLILTNNRYFEAVVNEIKGNNVHYTNLQQDYNGVADINTIIKRIHPNDLKKFQETYAEFLI